MILLLSSNRSCAWGPTPTRLRASRDGLTAFPRLATLARAVAARAQALTRFVLLAICAVAAACSRQSIPTVSATPPTTRILPVTETLHGTPLADNYRWLEGDNTDPKNPGKMTPEVAAWTDAQNAYTRAVLDQLPGRQALEARLRPLMRTGSVSAPIMRRNRYFFTTRTAAQIQPVISWRDGYLGADRVLVDPASLDTTGRTVVPWFSPSEDGRLLAYGTYHTGDSGPTLHLLDVDTGKPESLAIANVTEAIQWLPDSTGFIYQTIDVNGLQGLFHRMTGPSGADQPLYRQAIPAQMQSLPREWGPFASLSRDGHWMVLGFWRSPGSNDLWVANFDDFRKTGRLSAKVASVGVTGQALGTVVDGTLFLQTTKGAPHGRIVAVPAAAPAQLHWRDLVGERPDALIESVSFGQGRIAVTYRKNASDVIEVFDTKGESTGVLRTPGIGTASLGAEPDRAEAYVTFASFNYPATIFRVDLADPAGAPSLWLAPEVAVDPPSVEVEQVWYPSGDGTRISMFLARKVRLARTGNTPTMLLGYGAFGASLTPTFSPAFFQWFEAGGLLAVANVRGGGEYGQAWHQAGSLGRKQTSIDDFVAAAEWLTASKYTNPEKLALYGGEHGAVIAGAVLTQRPDLFRAAALRGPVLDMLRFQDFSSGREWVEEYGSAANADQFRWLLAYSPYQHVRAGTKYPGVLLTAIEDDPSVHAFHARKMAAALQAATASSRADHPVLLRVDRTAGLDPESLLNLQLRDLVDQRLFIMWQLGMR